uniref:Uncharacterized protein n=1 Tax=Mesocestoides corti TaxID=53468 RepID=A0A5K3F3H7_MESCO
MHKRNKGLCGQSLPRGDIRFPTVVSLYLSRVCMFSCKSADRRQSRYYIHLCGPHSLL